MAVIQPMSYMQSDWKDIIKQYGDLVETKRAEISSLRDWARKQPHLPILTDTQLVFFTILSKDSLERAKEICDRYVTLKTHHPEVFKDRSADVAGVKQVLEFVKIFLPCAYKSSHKGYRLCVIKLEEADVSRLNYQMAMKVFTAALDFELARNPFHKGLLTVLDAANFHMGYISKINIMITAIVFKYLQTIEKKIQEVHIINCNPVVSQVMSLIRPLMSKHLASLLHFHPPSKTEEFYEKFYPKKFMPSDYGGQLSSLEEADDEFRSRFLDAHEWFGEVDSPKYHVDETKRPKGSKSYSDEVIMSGSFKQLNID